MFRKIEQKLAQQRDHLEKAVRHAVKLVAFHIELGPDDVMKFGKNGDSYYVALPDTSADFIARESDSKRRSSPLCVVVFVCDGFAGRGGLPIFHRR